MSVGRPIGRLVAGRAAIGAWLLLTRVRRKSNIQWSGLSRGRRPSDGYNADSPREEPIRPMPTQPTVTFTDEVLANGLRLIIAVDRLAPVVAVNLWYNVGSKHEVAGKT